jgi:hypothetical protein
MSNHTQELHTSMRWAAEELAPAQFGDQRLRTRLIQIVAAKLATPRATIPQASQTWAATKATYNFFASQQVSADAIRAAHLHATRSRLANHHTLGVVQDTTELDPSSHRHTSGLGYLDNAYSSGVKVHSALAISTAGVPLGLVYQNVWSRDAATKGQKRRTLAQHERESQRWLTTLEQGQQAIAAPARLIVVADREADIYPLFIAPREERTDLLIRAAYNRGVSGGQNVEQVVEQVEWQGSHTVELPGNGQRASRNATLQIGWSSVEIQPPTLASAHQHHDRDCTWWL